MVLDSAAGHKDPVETGIRRDEIMCSVATKPLQRGTEAGESWKLFVQAGRSRLPPWGGGWKKGPDDQRTDEQTRGKCRMLNREKPHAALASSTRLRAVF